MSRLPLLLLIPALGCSDEPAAVSVPLTPEFTAGSGVVGERLAQATFDIDKKIKRINHDYDNWQVELKAKPALDIAVRRFTYPPGSHTGWHRHPGPVLIQVVQGTVTFYEAPDCEKIEVSAGESYVDFGEHAHIGRNESLTETAQDVTVLFGPPGIDPDAFRIDVTPAPVTCF